MYFMFFKMYNLYNFLFFMKNSKWFFFRIVYGTILSTYIIVPYNWNFFGLFMVFYMSKILLLHEYSICTSLLVSLQYLEMVQSLQMSSTLLNVTLKLLNHMLNWMDLHQMQACLKCYGK